MDSDSIMTDAYPQSSLPSPLLVALTFRNSTNGSVATLSASPNQTIEEVVGNLPRELLVGKQRGNWPLLKVGREVLSRFVEEDLRQGKEYSIKNLYFYSCCYYCFHPKEEREESL